MSDARDDSPAAPPGDSEQAPDFLIIGHVTRDLLPDGSARLGGTALYAAFAAQRLGRRVAIVTSAPPDLVAALRASAPGVAVAASLAPVATTFEHVYSDGVRRLFLRGRANPLSANDIPLAWRTAPIVLLAPLADEVDPQLSAHFPLTTLLAATAQGWLRRWDAAGAVIPKRLDQEAVALSPIRALILSYEDLLPPPGVVVSPLDGLPATQAEADTQLAAWAGATPLVVATRGATGAALWRAGAPPELFPGYPVNQIDATGAGDVFAAAFLVRLRETGDPRAAMDFANRCAALSVEGPGPSAIPTRDDVIARFGPLN